MLRGTAVRGWPWRADRVIVIELKVASGDVQLQHCDTMSVATHNWQVSTGKVTESVTDPASRGIESAAVQL
jgi:hypothetical protein